MNTQEHALVYYSKVYPMLTPLLLFVFTQCLCVTINRSKTNP